MPDGEFKITGIVKRFPMENGWHYIDVPKKFSDISQGVSRRGFIPIIARISDLTWKTSLLPSGNKTHFIALKAKIRKEKDIALGDKISVWFRFNI